MSLWRTRAFTLALIGLLAACTTVGPDYRLPKDSTYAKVQQRAPALSTAGSPALDATQPALGGRWWALYDDATLDGLVEQALAANTELKVAAAHLAQAQARYAQARAAGGFDGEVSATAARGKISAESLLLTEPLPPFNLADASLSVSYQLDLFGKIRRGVEAARAGTEAAQAAVDLARISVAAGVVGAYLEICHSNHEIAVAEHSVALQQDSRRVAARLQTNGRGTRTAVERADAQVALLEAAVPPLRVRRQAAGYELTALLGRTPDQVPTAAMQCQEAPQPRQAIPVGDGATLLRRRPDVREAERSLAAATAAVGVATAELYPDIRLGASVGANGLLADFGEPATQMWTLGPLVSWSIPGRGAQARVALAQAGASLALAEFDQTVLRALRETQSILDTYTEDLRRAAALREARDRSRNAAADVQRMYQAGREPYLSSLDSERTLANAEASLAGVEAQLSQDQVRLFLALGGGWQPTAPAGGGAP
jgi:NodT family efflux transporter outer membrane factor (OMF) lipoprotein